MAWGSGPTKSGDFRLASIDPALYLEWLAEVVDSGVLVSLGRSRDGGALSIAFVHNGRKGREWYADDEAFAIGMKELAEFLGVASRPAPPSTSASGTQRRRKGPSEPL